MTFVLSFASHIRFFALTLVIGFLNTPTMAQQDDLYATLKQVNTLSAAGQYDAALNLALSLERKIRKQYGTDQSNYAVALEALGNAYLGQQKYAEAEAALVRAVALHDQIVGPNQPTMAVTLGATVALLDVPGMLVTLGHVYKVEGKYADAIAVLDRAYALATKQSGQWSDATVQKGKELLSVLMSAHTQAMAAGRYNDAEVYARRNIQLCTVIFGPDNPIQLVELAELIQAVQHLGKAKDENDAAMRIVGLVDTGHHIDTHEFAVFLTALADHYRLMRGTIALPLAAEAVAIFDRLGATDNDSAGALHELAIIRRMGGHPDEAETLLKRALAIYEKTQGANSEDYAYALSDLGNALTGQSRMDEAFPLYQRAVQIIDSHSDFDNRALINSLRWIGLYLFIKEQQFDKSEAAYTRALEIAKKVDGEDSADVANTAVQLVSVYRAEKRFPDAVNLLRESISIQRKISNNAGYLTALEQLAQVYIDMGDKDAAQRLIRGAVPLDQIMGGEDAPSLQMIGGLLAEIGEYNEAYPLLLKAESIYDQRCRLQTLAAQTIDSSGLQVGDCASRLSGAEPLLHTGWQLAGGEPERVNTLTQDMFVVAQAGLSSVTSDAITQMTMRFVSGTDKLAVLVRRRQDLSLILRGQDSALVGALSDQSEVNIDAIRQQIAETESGLSAINAELGTDFPDYANLASPRPLEVKDAQNLLAPDEALLFFLAGVKETYLFALTRDAVSWRAIPVGRAELSQEIAAFRQGLDVDEINKSIRESKSPELFDLAQAHELYATLLGPIEPLIRDKKELLVVPSGPLTALPFHLLVTEKPPVAKPNQPSAYRDAAWLIKRQAVSVLPSVGSLKLLRRLAHKSEATKPLVGFGNPLFDPDATSANGPRQLEPTSARTLLTRSYAEYWRGLQIDRKMLSAAPPLPDTAIELKAVAQELGAPMSDVHLGADASVTAVKRLPLADYRIVYFATHGLVAGDVKGLGEPALLLSLPKVPTDFDDGLLTASEVAQLKLNADWVVLSACNTVAGDRPGAEALSGLARAFFYAGARALLVSQWAIATDAAIRLTTSTFDILKADPSLGRAEALRRAMLAYLNDPSNPRSAYPAYWGPFEIVGEGGIL